MMPRLQSGRLSRGRSGLRTALRLSGLLRVLRDAGPVNQDARFAADDPGVMTRRCDERVPRADLDLHAIVRPDAHAAGEHVASVVRLAAVATGNGLHVLRPLPSGFEGPAADGGFAERDDLHVPLSLERSRFVR